MPDITFTCEHCNQTLEAPDDLAGEEIECPSCGAAIVIPAGEAVEDPAAEIAAETQPTGGDVPLVTPCPSCKAPLAEGAVLCIHCGYHIKLGKHIETAIE